METIELIRKAEEEAAKSIAEAEAEVKNQINQAKEEAFNNLQNLQATKLKKETEAIFSAAEIEIKKLEKKENERRAKIIADLSAAVEKKINSAVSFVFNQILKK